MKNTTPFDVKTWLSSLERGVLSGSLLCPSFLKPFHLVTLALILKKENARWLELSEQIESYALRMGLWDAANIIPPYEMIAYPTQNKFLPVAPLEDPSDLMQVAKNLRSLVYQQNLGLDTFESVEIMLMELIENTFKHAGVKNKLHGLVCAQAWPKGNLAQVVFADSGMGIRKSLKENEKLTQELDHSNACQLACELGVTSKPNAHSGYGLALSRGLMKQSKGSMIVLSYNEGFFSQASKEATFTTSPWCGTLIILEWPINQPLSVNAVYESWPIPEGLEIDDFI